MFDTAPPPIQSVVSPETIRAAMGTRTNRAFDRYYQVDGNFLRGVYRG